MTILTCIVVSKSRDIYLLDLINIFGTSRVKIEAQISRQVSFMVASGRTYSLRHVVLRRRPRRKMDEGFLQRPFLRFYVPSQQTLSHMQILFVAFMRSPSKLVYNGIIRPFTDHSFQTKSTMRGFKPRTNPVQREGAKYRSRFL
jgi:hypothetical protein